MKDNILFKIIRQFRKPHIKTVVHYSDGVISMSGGDNPNPLTRDTKVEETYLMTRSDGKK